MKRFSSAGELPQAMQTGSTCRACFGSHILLLVIIAYLVGLPYLFLPVVEVLAACQQTAPVTRLFAQLPHTNVMRAETRNARVQSTCIGPLTNIAEKTLASSDYRWLNKWRSCVVRSFARWVRKWTFGMQHVNICGYSKVNCTKIYERRVSLGLIIIKRISIKF